MNEKAKKTYLTIIISITVICVIVGIVLHTLSGAGFTNGKTKTGSISVEDTDNIKIIKLDISISDIYIKSGSEFDVSYKDVNEKLIPSVSNKNGIVTIKQKSRNNNFNFNLFKGNKKTGKITIVVPEDTELIDLDVDISMGSLEMAKLSLDEAEFDLSMGSVEMNDVSIESLSADLSMGSIEVKDSKIEDSEIDLSMGSAEFKGSFDKIVGDVDMGSIEVDNNNDDCDYNLEASMGSIIVNGDDKGKSYKN